MPADAQQLVLHFGKLERPQGPYPVEADGVTVRWPVKSRFSDTGIKYTLIDVRDYGLVASVVWHESTAGYVIGDLRGVGKVALHNLLMQPGDGLEVDHARNDKLDNRRSELRVGTHAQNVANRARPTKNKNGGPVSSAFRGVKRDRKRWLALIPSDDGRQKYIGTYSTEESAALAWDAEARRRYGPFARLNFPNITLPPTEPIMERTVRFTLERTTKNALRFAEVDDAGKPRDLAEAVVGTLYVRKSALGGEEPQEITVTVNTTKAA